MPFSVLKNFLSTYCLNREEGIFFPRYLVYRMAACVGQSMAAMIAIISKAHHQSVPMEKAELKATTFMRSGTTIVSISAIIDELSHR